MVPNPNDAANYWPFPPPPPIPARPPGRKPRPVGSRANRAHGLTPRQNEFCECFVATGNAADAARRAGYRERSAKHQGHRLLHDARVQARVRALQTALADKIDPGLILGRLENLYRLAEQGGGYRAAAGILVLMSQVVGLDHHGMAYHLRTKNVVPETEPRLPSAVESMRAWMAKNGPSQE